MWGLAWWCNGKESSCSAGDEGSILGQGEPQEKEMATHSRILVWVVPWTEEPGGLQPMGSPGVKPNFMAEQRDMLRLPDCHLQRGEAIFKV